MLVLLVCAASLLIYTTDLGFFLKVYGVLPVFMVIFISGIARGFIGPAIFSFMPQIINDRQLYANAVSWNTTVLAGRFGGRSGYWWLVLRFLGNYGSL